MKTKTNQKESLNELFKLIRDEQVCLWVGAGFSLYAGYPSANGLKEKIQQELDGIHLNAGKELIDIAETFVIKRGRKELQDLIVKIFSVKPQETTYHNILAKIPHFNSIITTNYDKLIENAIGKDKCVIIRSNQEIARTSEKKVHVFKIHGDITRPKKLVLTKSDYSELYNKDNKSPFWAGITKEIASKHMLFLGYGYEDPNIWAQFSYIEKKLGKSKRQKFLVAPRLDPLKVEALNQKGILYIDMSGEEFVLELERHIKENVIFDLEGQLIRTDTGLGFLRNYGLVADLTPDKRGYKLKNVRGEKEFLSFELKFDTIDERLKNALSGDWNGEGGMEFTFTKENVTDLEVKIKDFLVFCYADLDKLSFVQVPFWKGEVQVEFPERDCSIEGLQIECYNLKNSTRITAGKNGFQIEIDFSFEEGSEPGFHFKFRMPEILRQVSHAIEFLNALDCLTNGVQLVIYSKDLPEEIPYSPSIIKENSVIKELLKTYSAIRTIEKHFKIKFINTNLKQINGDLPIIITIESLINDGWAAVDGNDIVMMYEESFDTIKNNIEAISPEQFVKCSYLNVPWKVLGRKIGIGRCQISIKGPRIIEHYPEKQMARIRSIDEKIYLKYERTDSNPLYQ